MVLMPYWRTWGAHLSNVETGIDGETLFSKDPHSPIGLERSVHGTISSFIFLPFVMRPFSKSALCVGCRTSLRALIRGLANQFKYQRRARRNFISFPISCACVGGFNSVPAPLIPTNSPPPRRTVTHLFAQECHRCRFSIYMYTLSSTYSPSTIAHYSCSFLFCPHSYRFISCACSTGVPHVTSSRRTVAVHIVKVHRRMRTPALLLAHVRACAYVLCTRGLRGRYNTSCGPFYDARITYVCEYTRKRARAQSRAHSRESVRTRARLSAVEHRTQCRKSVV